jgi:hypothetical protein
MTETLTVRDSIRAVRDNMQESLRHFYVESVMTEKLTVRDYVRAVKDNMQEHLIHC